jgi:hypothetical protein
MAELHNWKYPEVVDDPHPNGLIYHLSDFYQSTSQPHDFPEGMAQGLVCQRSKGTILVGVFR